jgi:hypothetical protein
MKITSVLGISSIVLAIVAIIAPMVYNSYFSKSTLELQLLSQVSILKKDPTLGKLSIHYDGLPINNLVLFRYVLINSGKKPIRVEDVVRPPTLRFSTSTKLVDARILRSDPKNIISNITIALNAATDVATDAATDVATDAATNEATIVFDLLNPSDFIEFSLYATGEDIKPIDVEARIIGIKYIDLIDKSEEPMAVRRTLWNYIQLVLFGIGFLGAFIAVIFFLINLGDILSDGDVEDLIVVFLTVVIMLTFGYFFTTKTIFMFW